MCDVSARRSRNSSFIQLISLRSLALLGAKTPHPPPPRSYFEINSRLVSSLVCLSLSAKWTWALSSSINSRHSFHWPSVLPSSPSALPQGRYCVVLWWVGPDIRGEVQLESYRAGKWLISLINILAFGFIWKLWICSFKWGMAACSPPGNDWDPIKNVEIIWLRPAQLGKPQNNTKFDMV